MNRVRSFAALLCVAALSVCGKGGVQDITGTVPGARIKFYNFGVNAPGVNFYANDTKMTAVSSTDTVESTTGTPYGGVAAGGAYTGIAPGQYTLTARITAATDKNLAIGSVATTLDDGKSYSMYLSGPYNAAAKKVDGFVVEDAYPAVVSSDSTYIRFVNAISNAGPLTLFVRNPTTSAQGQISASIAYKTAGSFVAFRGGGVVDLVVRAAGSTADAFTRTAVSFSPGHVYTITARGDITVAGSTATNRPLLDNTANK